MIHFIMEKKNLLLGNGGSYPTSFRPALGTDTSKARYTGFKQETVLLRKGSVRRDGAMPLPCDIVLERDVPVVMGDGATIYTDVFRPADNDQHPAIVAWSPYGKEVGGWVLDDVPYRAGVPVSALSGLEKFEGPDPAYWVSHGYVVLNPDIRGAYKSEGDIMFWSHRQALDGCDFIQWAANREWSNKKVGMTGNSWLAMSQWLIAAENPPHLAAIAPWEGCSDIYREITNRGGIPTPEFAESVIELFSSDKGMIEDMPRMTVEHPLFNAYWQDKAFKLENITTPAYVVASYLNPIHTMGTFEGFHRISSADKWLRVHLTHEWPDYYTPEHVEDLRCFFDHYLKGENNGWEDTPHVRLSLYGANEKEDIVDMPMKNWPVENTVQQKLYLDVKGHSLNSQPAKEQSVATYIADSPQHTVEFNMTFGEDTRIAGNIRLHLWVEAAGNDDMDLEASARIVSPDGTSRVTLFGPVLSKGRQRVSLRELDKSRSSDAIPVHAFTKEQRLKEGEIVPVDICLWPMGWTVRKGDTLRLTVGAYTPSPMRDPSDGTAKVAIPADGYTYMPGEKVEKRILGGEAESYPYADCVVSLPDSRNKGTHKIYTGDKYDSYLSVPFVV